NTKKTLDALTEFDLHRREQFCILAQVAGNEKSASREFLTSKGERDSITLNSSNTFRGGMAVEIQEHHGTVTQKGQVTIPLPVRKLLGIKPYDRIAFRVTEGRVELLPAHMTLETVYGAVRPRARPENWRSVRRQAREERARYRVAKNQPRRTGTR
ncbi:MAG: AbrB/MazE/SpoVT family DNA-binding domain-containing protein, partial [Chloroflexota bacterium]